MKPEVVIFSNDDYVVIMRLALMSKNDLLFDFGRELVSRGIIGVDIFDDTIKFGKASDFILLDGCIGVDIPLGSVYESVVLNLSVAGECVELFMGEVKRVHRLLKLLRMGDRKEGVTDKFDGIDLVDGIDDIGGTDGKAGVVPA